MFNFGIFLVVGLIATIFLLIQPAKLKTKNIAGFLGVLLLFAGSGLTFIFDDLFTQIIPVIVFCLGVVVYISGMYHALSIAGDKKTSQSVELQAKTVSDILQVAATRESLIELLNYSLDRYLELFSLNSGAIHIFHKTRNSLIMGAYRGLTPSRAKKLEQITPGETAIGRTVQNKRVLIIRDLRVSPDFQFFGGKAEGYSFLAVAPIIVDDDCWGVITLLGRKKYHRGMLDIDQLEQFGYKLGQALELGRENRRITAALKKLHSKLEFYNLMLNLFTPDWLENDETIFKALSAYPLTLFGGRQFGIIQVFSGKCRCVYIHGLADLYTFDDTGFSDEVDIDRLVEVFKAEKYFRINLEDFAGLLPSRRFKNKKPVCYGYQFDEKLFGIIIFEETKITEVQNYEDDLRLIGSLFNLNCFKTLYQAGKTENEQKIPDDLEVTGPAGDLLTTFNNIDSDIQALIEQISQGDETLDTEYFKQQLARLEQAVFDRMTIAGKSGLKNNPNNIINSILEREKMDVAFYPGLKLPRINENQTGFENIVSEILKEATQDNRKIKIKTSSQNHSIKLSIEGDLTPRFPSDDLIEKARLHNIEIITPIQENNSPDANIIEKDDVETKAGMFALVVSNKNKITELLESLFPRIGYDCMSISSAKESRAFLESNKNNDRKIDVAVIDMALEDIPGLELSRMIKEFDNNIYTIIITSWGVNLYKNTLEDAGVDAVLHKPFRLEQLNKALPVQSKDAVTD